MTRPDIFEHAQHLHLKLIDAIARKHGASDAALPRANVFEGENVRRGGEQGRQRNGGQGEETLHSLILARGELSLTK